MYPVSRVLARGSDKDPESQRQKVGKDQFYPHRINTTNLFPI